MKGKSDAGVAASETELNKALSCIDWQQVVENGGPPCFFIENERFCLRAERWVGHGILHSYVSLTELVNSLKPHATTSNRKHGNETKSTFKSE